MPDYDRVKIAGCCRSSHLSANEGPRCNTLCISVPTECRLEITLDLDLKTGYVLTRRDLSERPLKFRQRQVDSIVLDILAKTVNCLQQYVDFAKIAKRTSVPTKHLARSGLFMKLVGISYPLPSSTRIEPD
jgi:hypothetical protein